MKFLLILGLFYWLPTSIVFAQVKGSAQQNAGDCAVNITGGGNNVSLECKNVDPKLADQIRSILSATSRSEKNTRDISQKLDVILTEISKGQKLSEPPDVALRFIYPKSPALVIENRSAVIARDIKWTLVLWNMDLPERNDPLPIPVQKFDWLRPNDEGGPQNLFSTPAVASLLKTGNRLFGSASVNCPECARGRTYIVQIIWGERGWFSELENEKSGRTVVPSSGSEVGRADYFKRLEEEIPLRARIPIRDSRSG
jgi:hypothetical protein